MNSLFFSNGHGIYILSAFAFSTVILILNLWMPFRRYRQITHRSKQNEPSS